MNHIIRQPALLLAVILTACQAFAGEPDPAAPSDPRPTLWLIGDSTVKYGGDAGKGWGEVIADRFDLDRIRVMNRAIGGRSSRTYRTEGRWDAVLKDAKPGDFVLMQFGHNDPVAPDDPERPRGSLRGIGDEYRDIINPKTNEPERVYTFGWYMRHDVTEAQEHALIPIVCSYIPRAPRQGQKPDPELSSYGLWARQVAEAEHAAFIDLYGRISRAYVAIEDEHPHSVKERFFVGGDRDYTHTNEAGAAMNAAIVVEAIRDLDDTLPAAKLKGYLKAP